MRLMHSYQRRDKERDEHKQKELKKSLYHELINYIDTKAKWRHLKKMTCKETLRQVFIRVY